MTKTIHPLRSHYSSTKWKGGERRFFKGGGALILHLGGWEGRLLDGAGGGEGG